MKPDSKEITNLSEKGFSAKGEATELDRRLFVLLLVFGECKDSSTIIDKLKSEKIEAVLYEDINDPEGIGVLTFSEDPDFFVNNLRNFLKKNVLSNLILNHKYTMLGRTYSIGHERNLEDWLLKRPIRLALTPENRWAVWYPLRRKGEFALLSGKEQGEILMEHGVIGHAFGKAGLAQDIRLACHGLDTNDNDFVIGLIGKELFPLSAIVQAMRKTKQTSTYIEKMGPFFVGRTIWQSDME